MSDLKKEFDDMEGASVERLLIAARPFAQHMCRLPERCQRARAELARRIKTARLARGRLINGAPLVSSVEMAGQVGVSPNHYSQAERGTSCPSEVLARIARHLLGEQRKEDAA